MLSNMSLCRFIFLDSFFSIVFVFNEVFIELKMIYDKEDRYGKKIEDRIIDSIEIIEEL